LQILFSWDARHQPIDDAIESYFNTLYPGEPGEGAEPDAFAGELARGAVRNAAEIDARIAKHAEHWRVERMPAVDRNLLRLAVFEMTSGKTPAAVVIDEAIELARKFSGEESAQFVNGVLDAIHREAPAGEVSQGSG
jgi:N utilization substance protein B